MAEDLVDLSLFSYSPTDDRRFTVTGSLDLPDATSSRSITADQPPASTREFYAPSSTSQPDYENLQPTSIPRPLPSAICGRIRIPSNHGRGLNRPGNPIKRKRTNECSGTGDSNISRRRNVPTPPQLLLSAPPPSRQSNGPVSELVWMPEEQMWLVIGDRERNSDETSTNLAANRLSTAPNRTRSAPTTRMSSHFNVTPPLTPVQWQLRSLIEPRDEERLSPLFQEAINSVPMEGTHDSCSPSLLNVDDVARHSSPDSFRSAPDFRDPCSTLGQVNETASSRAALTRAASYSSGYTNTASAFTPSGSSLSALGLTASSRLNSNFRPTTEPVSPMSLQKWLGSTALTIDQSPTSEILNNQSNANHLERHRTGAKSWSGWARKLARSRSTI